MSEVPLYISRSAEPDRGTSLIRKHLLLGPYSRPMPRADDPRGVAFSYARGTPVDPEP